MFYTYIFYYYQLMENHLGYCRTLQKMYLLQMSSIHNTLKEFHLNFNYKISAATL